MELILTEGGKELFRTEFTRNVCFLRGRLGDVTKHSTVNRSSLMISQGKDQTGNWKPSAFINIVDFDGRLDGRGKGDLLYGVFRYSQRKYTDRNGQERTATDFILQAEITEDGQQQPKQQYGGEDTALPFDI